MLIFQLLKYSMEEAPKVHVVNCSSAAAKSHKWHNVNLSINYSNLISKLLRYFASDILFERVFRKLMLPVVANNFLLEFVIRCCLSTCFYDNVVFKLRNNLSLPFAIFIEISHHHSQPFLTGLSKPKPFTASQQMPFLVFCLNMQTVLTIILFPRTDLT